MSDTLKKRQNELASDITTYRELLLKHPEEQQIQKLGAAVIQQTQVLMLLVGQAIYGAKNGKQLNSQALKMDNAREELLNYVGDELAQKEQTQEFEGVMEEGEQKTSRVKEVSKSLALWATKKTANGLAKSTLYGAAALLGPMGGLLNPKTMRGTLGKKTSKKSPSFMDIVKGYKNKDDMAGQSTYEKQNSRLKTQQTFVKALTDFYDGPAFNAKYTRQLLKLSKKQAKGVGEAKSSGISKIKNAIIGSSIIAGFRKVFSRGIITRGFKTMGARLAGGVGKLGGVLKSSIFGLTKSLGRGLLVAGKALISPLGLQVMAVIGAAVAGWKLGAWLDKKFKLSDKISAGTMKFLEKVNLIPTAAELGKSTKDAVTQALKNEQRRLGAKTEAAFKKEYQKRRAETLNTGKSWFNKKIKAEDISTKNQSYKRALMDWKDKQVAGRGIGTSWENRNIVEDASARMDAHTGRSSKSISEGIQKPYLVTKSRKNMTDAEFENSLKGLSIREREQLRDRRWEQQLKVYGKEAEQSKKPHGILKYFSEKEGQNVPKASSRQIDSGTSLQNLSEVEVASKRQATALRDSIQKDRDAFYALVREKGYANEHTPAAPAPAPVNEAVSTPLMELNSNKTKVM